jgi:hypothetical protein
VKEESITINNRKLYLFIGFFLSNILICKEYIFG